MFSKTWIPVRLTKDVQGYPKNWIGHVAFLDENEFKQGLWFYIPDDQPMTEGFFLKRDCFEALRSMQTEPGKSFLRKMSLPYSMVYDTCFINPPGSEPNATQIDVPAAMAINLLVRYAEELEKQIEELLNEQNLGNS